MKTSSAAKPVSRRKSAFFYFALAFLIVAILLSFIGLPKLRLVGASQDSNGDTVALIENSETHDQDVFDVNQSPFNVGNIIDIQNDKVVIEHEDGTIETLMQKNTVIPDNEEVTEIPADFPGSEEYYNQFFDIPEHPEDVQPDPNLPIEP